MSGVFLVLIYIIAVLLIMLLTIGINKVNWMQSDFSFNNKKLIDCVAYFIPFVCLVFAHYLTMYFECPVKVTILIIVSSILSVAYSFYTFTSQIFSFNKLEYNLNPKVFPFILASLLVGVLMSLTTLNYIIYMIWPNCYEFTYELSFVETAFEFIYYSFMLAITYSSGAIAATHIVTKFIQMIEICYCYILIGGIIAQLIDKVKNQKVG